MSECKSCGAEILWATTKAGKRIPLDAARVSPGSGRFLLVQSQVAGEPIALPAVLLADLNPDASLQPSLYVSHFSTCPDADSHRK